MLAQKVPLQMMFLPEVLQADGTLVGPFIRVASSVLRQVIVVEKVLGQWGHW